MSTRLNPVFGNLFRLKNLEKILQKSGFSDIIFWENYSKATLQPKTSDSLLCVAKKKK